MGGEPSGHPLPPGTRALELVEHRPPTRRAGEKERFDYQE